MNKMKTIGKWLIPAAMAAMPLLTLAQIPLPGITPAGTAWTLDRVRDLINTIATFAITFGVIIAIIFIIYGGIRYMTAGGDPTAQGKAKTAIWNGIIGAAIVIGVGVILRTLSAAIAGTFFSV